MKKQAVRRIIGAALLTAFASNAAAESITENGAVYKDPYPTLDITLDTLNTDLGKMTFHSVSGFPEMCIDADKDGRADVMTAYGEANYVRDHSLVHSGYILPASSSAIEMFDTPIAENDAPALARSVSDEAKRLLTVQMNQYEGLAIVTMDDQGKVNNVLINRGFSLMAAGNIERDDHNIVLCPTEKPQAAVVTQEQEPAVQQSATPHLTDAEILKALQDREQADKPDNGYSPLLQSYSLQPEYLEWGGMEKLLEVPTDKARAVNQYAHEGNSTVSPTRVSHPSPETRGQAPITSLSDCFERVKGLHIANQTSISVCAANFSPVVVIKITPDDKVAVALPSFPKPN